MGRRPLLRGRRQGPDLLRLNLLGYTGKTEDEDLDTPLGWVWSFEHAAKSSKDCKYHADKVAGRGRQPRYSVAPDFKKLSAEERIELGLLSRAMGSFASDDASRGQMEKSLDEVLSLKDLRELSLRDLRLLRNTLYARRGRPFKSPLLQEHFARMPWYKPDPAYTDARLTKNDQRNAKLIQSVEKELGGALKDEDFLIADPEQRAPDPAFLSGA
ncbi:YARHG domain-containing protein [Cystobacter ferrugineus]|uniref:YARHG domain-containing protein n=1 Tax=Cystobacter ferrugineus TaxID=83449 RepID=UPI001161190B|nr:YARHG domain-containing protein [Cystobacter ferrugineus]